MKVKLLTKLLLVTTVSLTLTGCKSRCGNLDWSRLRQKNNEKDMNFLYSRAYIPDHPLNLDEIIQIALSRNLNLLVKQQQYKIQREVVTREKYNMLPKLMLNWENDGRNENTASYSESLVPGVPPAPLSISSEQYIQRWDINVVFNLVDFGLAFYRTQQECNKVLMAQLEYERLRQTMVVDITKQYWKAIASKVAIEKSTSIIDTALQQQVALQRQMESKVISEIQGLRNENQLINIRGQLQAYYAEYHNAMGELGLLMGMPADIDFTLAEIEVMGVDVDLGDVGQLEAFALVNRPELYSGDAEERVRADEARAAIIQMLPGAELFGGPFHDSNLYLLYNNWLAAGIRATWNLLDFPAYYRERQVACSRKQLAKLNRITLAAGVISQVHLSFIVFQDNLESYLIAKELESVNKRLLLAAKNEQRQGKLHEADILKYEAESLFSEIDAATKYAQMQNTLEQLNSAIGLPRYFKTNTVYKSSHECSELYDTENACDDYDFCEAN